MIKKPNLFIIGAMKSGTTSLARYLSTHPEIFVPAVKEPFHFSREENWSKGNNEYLELFANAQNQKYLVDASTDYTKFPKYGNVAERIYNFNPETKIIYLIRDPFDRIVSNYKHEVKRGRETKKLSEALRTSSEYLTNSYYAYQLEPYFNIFDKNRIYVTTFEEMKNNPIKFFKSLFNWLGINENIIPDNINEKFNVSPSVLSKINDNSIRTKLMRNLKNNSFVSSITPKYFQNWLKGKILPHKLIVDFKSEIFLQEVENARKLLTPLLALWVQELEKITEQKFVNFKITDSSIEGSKINLILNNLCLPEELHKKLLTKYP